MGNGGLVGLVSRGKEKGQERKQKRKNDECKEEEWDRCCSLQRRRENARARGRGSEWKARAIFSIFYAAAISYRKTRRYVCASLWIRRCASWIRVSVDCRGLASVVVAQRNDCRCGCSGTGVLEKELLSVAWISISTLLREYIFTEKCRISYVL